MDFVIESKRSVFAVEVKAASRWNDDDLSGLRAFLARTPDCKAALLVYNGKDAHKIGDRLYAIPMGTVLA